MDELVLLIRYFDLEDIVQVWKVDIALKELWTKLGISVFSYINNAVQQTKVYPSLLVIKLWSVHRVNVMLYRLRWDEIVEKVMIYLTSKRQ